MECLAIIPARGGSKGVPRKNIRVVGGKPLIAHTIGHALQANHVTRVVVSTDDPEIGGVAQEWGAEVVWRPAEISGDAASSESALLHVLEHLRQAEGYQPDLVVFLQCTSPLTAPEDIDGTILALVDEGADSALAAVDFHYFLWRRDERGDGVGINHAKHVRLLRQQRQPEYLETGAVYVMRTDGFLEAKHRFFGKTALYVMPAERRLEIDEESDLALAEVIMRQHTDAAQRTPLAGAQVGLIVLDFDGVLTDNRVLVDQEGREAVTCSRADGWGVSLLRQAEYRMICLSTEENRVVSARCRKLGIECIQGQKEKWPTLSRYLAQSQIAPSRVMYVGNDTNDLECMRQVGYPVAVADAHPTVRAVAVYVTDAAGGNGPIRELADILLGNG